MEESTIRACSSHFSIPTGKHYGRRTIPVGRPSWKADQGNKASDADSQTDNNDQQPREAEDGSNRTVGDSSRITPTSITSNPVMPQQPVGPHLTNGPAHPKPYVHRPKSLALKSFIYIGESRTVHDQSSTSASTKKAGLSSSNQLARNSETLRDKFLVGNSNKSKQKHDNLSELSDDSTDLDTTSETSLKVVRLSPGRDGKHGFKIRELSFDNQNCEPRRKKGKSIIIYDVSWNSPAAACDPRLYEGDQLITINGKSIEGFTESKVESMIENIQNQDTPELILEVSSKYNIECTNNRVDSSGDLPASKPVSALSNSKKLQTLSESIKDIKRGLEGRSLVNDFEKLPRKKEDDQLDESKLNENIDKNRYEDIIPYDSTRVQLIDSMTGDYINASFVDMTVPSGVKNRYIAAQGPLQSTCDDFWQMVWEQNCSLIIMVTPLIEAGRVKCHKYWPEEREDFRYGQLLIRCLSEKSKSATINRTIELLDVKSGEKKVTKQIQYKAWPDHETPEDCGDFLKLVNRVRKHRLSYPDDPIVVHCSAGIGRTGVLILMETALCIMESGGAVYPIKIVEEMRRQRAMLIQTSSQFQFVARAICKVYDQRLYKKFKKHRRKKNSS